MRLSPLYFERMKLIEFPAREQWPQLLQRPVFDNRQLQQQVKEVLQAVKENGDIAVKKFTQQFDGVMADALAVTATEMQQAEALLSADLKKAIEQAAANIRLFHEMQVGVIEKIDTMPGITCWRKSVGIEKVGLYIPV